MGGAATPAHADPARHPRDRPRGVPDGPRRVEGGDLPHPARLGRIVRSRDRRGDGAPDRRVDAHARHPPGAGSGARRDPRPALGTGGRVHRRGPLRRRHDRHRVRARAAGCRGRRDAQALRRVLGLAVRPQSRAGVGGPARSRRRAAAAVRDGRARRRGAQRDELLRRDRRDAGRRVDRVPDRTAARRLGVRGGRGRGLLLRPVPADDARDRRGRRRRRAARTDRRNRRRAAEHRGVRSPPARARGVGRGGRSPRRSRRHPGARAEGAPRSAR